MNIKVEIIGNETVDISKHFVGTDPIPIYERNRDYSPIISSFKFDIGEKSNIGMSKGDEVRISFDDVVRFSGVIEHFKFNYQSRRWNVDTFSDLVLLQKKVLQYSELNGALTQYIIMNDNQSPGGGVWFHHYQILNVLKAMFSAGGLTLDTSEVANVVLGYYRAGGSDHNLTGSDFVFDYETLYAINQSYACNHAKVDSDLNDYKISCWDFVSIICSYFSYAVIRTAAKSYKLKYAGALTTYTKENSTAWNYSLEQHSKRVDQLVPLQNYAERVKYYDTNLDALDLPAPLPERSNEVLFAPSAQRLRSQVKWYRNLRILHYDTAPGALPNYIKNSADQASLNLISYWADSYDYIRQELETNITFSDAYDLISHHVLLDKQRRSKLIWDINL